MLSKVEAKVVADSLKKCPFCGSKLTLRVLGSGDMALNPSARCKTEGCMGGKLPSLCLDVPSDVQAWNQRSTDN